MSDSAEIKVMRPAPLLQQRWFRVLVGTAILFWGGVLVMRLGIGFAQRWNPYKPEHMAVRNGLYELVDTLRSRADRRSPLEETFLSAAGPILERPGLREFSIYLTEDLVVHGPESTMPRITPLRFEGDGAPRASASGRDTFYLIAARRTGENRAVLWGMNPQREIVFREFSIVRPALE